MPNIKELQKEVQVHKALKNNYIIEFIHSEIIEKEKEREGWVAGLYVLLELAVGGDLFDKIGEQGVTPPWVRLTSAPDVGVPEDLAKFYFAQLASGIVSRQCDWRLTCRSLSTPKVSLTETLNPKTCFLRQMATSKFQTLDCAQFSGIKERRGC